MAYSDKIKTTFNKSAFVQKMSSSRTYRRVFIGFLILAGLLAVIVPTWQVYTEEGRSSTLISYRDPNIRGESLFISATVLEVDFSEKTYRINFVVRPNGTLANEYGQLNQDITLRFSSIKKYHIESGDAINPIQINFNFFEGNEIDYPLDSYTGYFDLFAYYKNDTNQSIPITFHLDASLTSFHFLPRLDSPNQHSMLLPEGADLKNLNMTNTVPPANLNDRVSLKIVTGRSTATRGFAIFICILMWLLSVLMGMFGCQVVFKKRRADAHACMIGITTLFALPAVRSAQPGIPDIGCVSDILGFYWNIAIVALASIAVIMCWVMRWEHPLNDIELAHYHEDREMKRQSCMMNEQIRQSIMLSRQQHQQDAPPRNSVVLSELMNNSSTSISTCVEPSLRDV